MKHYSKVLFLLHTGDKSEHIWDYWYHYYKMNFNLPEVNTVFLSENFTKLYDRVSFEHTGNVDWSTGLINFLENIDSKYIIYHHEDYFITEKTDGKKLNDLISICDKNNIKLMKICGDWGGSIEEDTFENTDLGENIYLYKNDKMYLVSHQGSIWNREFLIGTLKKGENPWEHEINGTMRLKERSEKIYAYRGKSPIPYQETIVNGTIRIGCEGLFGVDIEEKEIKKSLALNMIVGANESYELDRCLKSFCIDGLYDEIVIVLTSKDEKVKDIASKYTDKIIKFEWINDFAAARNCALENTTSTHIMWLDADDICDDVSQSRLLKMKEFVLKDTHDIFLVPYDVTFDYAGNVIQTVQRDRIFTRRINPVWKGAVHEQIFAKNRNDKMIASFAGISITHKPEKESSSGVYRNLQILKECYENDKSDPHYAFYYARDLMLVNEKEKGASIFDDLLRNKQGSNENLFIAAFELAIYNTYEDGGIKKDTVSIGETYANIALSFSDKHAEPYVILGDIAGFRENSKAAINHYKNAMRCDYRKVCFRQVPFYEQIPAERMAIIYATLNEDTSLEQSLYYNKIALKYEPKNKKLLEQRKELLKKLLE
jgi:hypothetical protein